MSNKDNIPPGFNPSPFDDGSEFDKIPDKPSPSPEGLETFLKKILGVDNDAQIEFIELQEGGQYKVTTPSKGDESNTLYCVFSRDFNLNDKWSKFICEQKQAPIYDKIIIYQVFKNIDEPREIDVFQGELTWKNYLFCLTALYHFLVEHSDAPPIFSNGIDFANHNFENNFKRWLKP